MKGSRYLGCDLSVINHRSVRGLAKSLEHISNFWLGSTHIPIAKINHMARYKVSLGNGKSGEVFQLPAVYKNVFQNLAAHTSHFISLVT